MKKFFIDRNKIRSFDIGYTSDYSPFAFIEKGMTDSWRTAFTDFSCKLPSHVFLFVEVYGRIQIIEMVMDKNDHNIAKISMNHISKYEGNGLLGERIVGVKRCSFYDDDGIRKNANERLLERWSRQEDRYDYAGIFSYLIPAIREQKDHFYCSELVEDAFEKDGLSITGHFEVEKTMKIPPIELFKSRCAFSRSGLPYTILNIDCIA